MTVAPMFRIGSEEFDDGPLGYAASAEGLFADSENPEPGNISFTGLTRIATKLETWAASRGPDLLDVDVVSSTGRLLGHYDLDAASIHLADVDSASPSLSLEQAHPISLPGGLPLWLRWCDESKPLEPKEWLRLSAEHRGSWLRIARAVWGVNGYSRRSVPSSEPAYVDGSLVTDETTLYLVLGEALAGPGGYVGWGLDALDDCLSTLVTSPTEVSWVQFPQSREALGAEYLTEVLEVLESRDVSVAIDS